MQNEFFKIGGMELKYYQPTNSERTIEIPLLAHFIQRSDKEEVIEVGAVSNHYFPSHHRIYDPTDTGAIKEFAERLDYAEKNVVSISTVEHIGRAEYGLSATSPYRAIIALSKMLEAQTYLITWPIGYNPLLDNYAKNVLTIFNDENVITAKRDADNNWEVTNPRVFDFEYNAPYPLGNAIFIITNLEELLH